MIMPRDIFILQPSRHRGRETDHSNYPSFVRICLTLGSSVHLQSGGGTVLSGAEGRFCPVEPERCRGVHPFLFDGPRPDAIPFRPIPKRRSSLTRKAGKHPPCCRCSRRFPARTVPPGRGRSCLETISLIAAVRGVVVALPHARHLHQLQPPRPCGRETDQGGAREGRFLLLVDKPLVQAFREDD